ncbi:MAG TPA: valine--tRNA ligase [Planctomycetota bacterium]|nr:valine--tRNA ligase [Planctomycetota bacterium]HRR80613.1 valine--tRNA ligase [Planctomycetota bacterium]HRT95322.1 valine--tRNA ligase [Planctomycetota bacterium]
MELNLPTRYDPAAVEQRWYRFWEERGYFNADPDPARKPYTIVIPPPNVTGVLHLGHVLNNTFQDILTRWRRMQGYNALWQPGTDHAGIATQSVVERLLDTEGTSRHALGREKFVERVWQVKAKHLATINEQLRRLGASLDWRRERFTMDEGLSRAVLEVFVRLYNKGLVYRDRFMINWCPFHRTALSNDEVDHRTLQGGLWWIRYPFKRGTGGVTVATTRPETMLGDTAVAVNPHDPRYQGLIGKTVVLPLMNREIPIIADEYVDKEFGTGALKITPAHDPNDFAIGRRHGLAAPCVIAPDGSMSAEAGPYAGLDRFECRKRVVADLQALGLLEKHEPHQHEVGHCYRCDSIVEPYISLQWFVRMKPLAERARKVAEDKSVRFWPPRWETMYYHWIDTVPDWPISRQLWWGHRIPAWYCQDCPDPKLDPATRPPEPPYGVGGRPVVSAARPDKCPQCGGTNFLQDEDVLDTWFSSWLWPFSTLGWPDDTPDLRYFYPTSTLVTGPDILGFWVARMIMAGLEFLDAIPFTDVYLHGIVRDDQGRKMSKSLGNSPDPLDVMNEFGADALRFSIILITASGQDAYYSHDKVAIGRNFANKLWNASRLVLTNLAESSDLSDLSDGSYASDDLSLEDRWILSRLSRVTATVTDALERFNFNEAAMALYEFIWHELCDWYLEAIKPRIRNAAPEARASRFAAQSVVSHVLDGALRLLHPFAPFITEEIWQHLGKLLPARGTLPAERTPAAPSVMIAPWPQPDGRWLDAACEATFTQVQEIIRAIRAIRKKMRLADRSPRLRAVISLADAAPLPGLEANRAVVCDQAALDALDIGLGLPKPPHAAAAVLAGMEVYVPLEGVIDFDAERKRLGDQLAKTRGFLEGSERKLANANFVERAPHEVVAKEREQNARLREEIARLEANLAELL